MDRGKDWKMRERRGQWPTRKKILFEIKKMEYNCNKESRQNVKKEKRPQANSSGFKEMMKNKRLEKIIEYLPPCRMLADIGTDHGYIPVEAVKSGKAQRAVAADISRGSLEKAITEIERQGLRERIEARCGSGLKVLCRDEADVVVIAGMGGELIGEILVQDYREKFPKTAPLLILQPVQFPDRLRRFLFREGFSILEEDLVKDEGIIYHLMIAKKAERGAEDLPSEIELELGAINIRKNTPLLRELTEMKIRACEKLTAELQGKSGERVRRRLKELQERRKEYEALAGREA